MSKVTLRIHILRGSILLLILCDQFAPLCQTVNPNLAVQNGIWQKYLPFSCWSQAGTQRLLKSWKDSAPSLLPFFWTGRKLKSHKKNLSLDLLRQYTKEKAWDWVKSILAGPALISRHHKSPGHMGLKQIVCLLNAMWLESELKP